MIPDIGPEVFELVENRAVTFTTLGFEASFVGENVSTRPEVGDVYAVMVFGCEAAACGAGDEEGEEKRSTGIADDVGG